MGYFVQRFYFCSCAGFHRDRRPRSTSPQSRPLHGCRPAIPPPAALAVGQVVLAVGLRASVDHVRAVGDVHLAGTTAAPRLAVRVVRRRSLEGLYRRGEARLSHVAPFLPVLFGGGKLEMENKVNLMPFGGLFFLSTPARSKPGQ